MARGCSSFYLLGCLSWGAADCSAFSAEIEEHAATLATRLRQIGCFHLIVFGWLLFRVQDMHTFVDYLQGFARLTGETQLSGLFYVVLAGTAISHVVSIRHIESCTQWFLARPVPVQAALYATLLLLFCGLTFEAPSFIYFQF